MLNTVLICEKQWTVKTWKLSRKIKSWASVVGVSPSRCCTHLNQILRNSVKTAPLAGVDGLMEINSCCAHSPVDDVENRIFLWVPCVDLRKSAAAALIHTHLLSSCLHWKISIHFVFTGTNFPTSDHFYSGWKNTLTVSTATQIQRRNLDLVTLQI